MKNIFSKKSSKYAGLSFKALLVAFLLPLTFALEGCVHAPKQAWTPTKRRNMKDSKPHSPKYEKRLHTRKAW